MKSVEIPEPIGQRLDDEAAAESQAKREPLAWELIDVGRYMPRRIRGSFRGRVLG